MRKERNFCGRDQSEAETGFETTTKVSRNLGSTCRAGRGTGRAEISGR